MFNFFRKTPTTPKPPKTATRFIVQDVEVEDVTVSFEIVSRANVTKTFFGTAQYYPSFSSRDDGMCIISAEVDLDNVITSWQRTNFAMFDDILVPVADIKGATITRTYRIVHVQRPEMTS